MGAASGTMPWNAGTSEGWTDKRGYRWRYVTVNGKRRAKREHRHIMEEHLGRALEPWELVHHKDGDPLNNDIGNLALTTFGGHTAEHHTGSRRDEAAKRSMEAFALMREELRRERETKADLLAVLRKGLALYERELLHLLPAKDAQAFLSAARATIAKAEGRAAIAKAEGR